MLRYMCLLILLGIPFGCADKNSPFSLDTSPVETASDDTEGAETDSALSTDRTPTDSISTDSSEKATSSDSMTSSDSEGDSSSETDSIQDTGRLETDSGSEVEVAASGQLGERCWIPVLSSGHPNAGLPDCRDGLRCIGDSDEAWCTLLCSETGELSSVSEISGWCCGEIGSPCDPTRYFMPTSMSANCAPRVLDLGEPCEASGDARCAPVCEGTEILVNSLCVQVQGGGFCSYPCTQDGDCTAQPAFGDGCCSPAMGNQYCMMPSSGRCP